MFNFDRSFIIYSLLFKRAKFSIIKGGMQKLWQMIVINVNTKIAVVWLVTTRSIALRSANRRRKKELRRSNVIAVIPAVPVKRKPTIRF